ncbi:MAG: hypothetical protein CMI59_11755 [Parvibaculum sp.]|nr:hypothetical protein [Parvibaculum sp.]
MRRGDHSYASLEASPRPLPISDAQRSHYSSGHHQAAKGHRAGRCTARQLLGVASSPAISIGSQSELDYVEQASWVLFLKYLEDLEGEREDVAALPNQFVVCRSPLPITQISRAGSPRTIFSVSMLTVITRWKSSRGYAGLSIPSIA